MTTKLSRYWMFQIGGWGGFASIFLFFAYFFNQADHNSAIRLMIFVLLGILCSHLMKKVVIKIELLQKPLNKQVAVFILITFCTAILMSFLYIETLLLADLLKKSDKVFMQKNGRSFYFNILLVILNNAFLCFMLFFIWNLLYFVFHYIEKSRKQQLDTLKLESLVRDLELQTIKSHINPHFIFNSLNSIRALVDENPQRAREAVTELSNILRSSMQSDKLETVPFERELAIVQDYLALEYMRFEDRLKVEYDIDVATLEQPVPPMMLQTLVENAIKHGINKKVNGGVVKITSTFTETHHLFGVQNTGRLDEHENTGGFGLFSTTSRLSLLYGEKAKFQIRQITDELVEANVSIPIYLK